MANINFPNNPVQDDIFTVGGKTYTYDGVKWVANTTITKTDVGLENVQNYGVASQAEAEAGTLDNKYMTPLKTAQAINVLSPAPTIASQAEAEAGTDNTVFMTPLRTSQAIVELSPPTDVSTEYAAGVIEDNATLNTNFWVGTQAEYDAIGTYDNNTLYFIKG